jgi:lipid-binding SYLF domain-containing protein
VEAEKMGRIKIWLCSLLVVLIFGGCAITIEGDTPEAKRRTIFAIKNEVLTELYNIRPEIKAKISAAPGYAVFSNANLSLFLVSAGVGHGVVHRKGAKPIFMKMGEFGVGIGLGVKDFRAVFIFRDKVTLNKFIKIGWEFGAYADAAAKAGDTGVAIGDGILNDGITIYQLTENGLMIRAAVNGTKYWIDSDLN